MSLQHFLDEMFRLLFQNGVPRSGSITFNKKRQNSKSKEAPSNREKNPAGCERYETFLSVCDAFAPKF